MHNNDPRHVQNTYPIRKVSFREAAELAYFGAKILHPTCVIPAETAGIPIRLKNTFTPGTSGTLISGGIVRTFGYRHGRKGQHYRYPHQIGENAQCVWFFTPRF